MARLIIGLITYNGAETIRRSIDSLLAQTFTDFELLIFDNASTDGTSEICAAYMKADPRVRHIRHPVTIPQSANFRGVLMEAKSELFMWASDDDIWGPDFATACINELDRNPQAVSACTRVLFRCADGSEYPARGTFSICGNRRARLRSYLSNPRDSARLYGVYRSEGLKRAYPSDVNFFAYDWLVVGLSMCEGEHIEADTMQLVRSANPPGKYFEKYSRHFTREKGLVGSLSYFLPLLPLTREFRRQLETSDWKAARGKLLRLNLHQMILLLKWKYPVFEGLFRALRRIDRAMGNS